MESTDVARLILEADQRGFPEVQAAIAATRQKLDVLAAGYQAGAVKLEDYLEKGRALQGELDGLRDGYDAATAALKKHGDAHSALAALTAQSTNKMAGFGQAGLQAGRVIQDFTQGGIGGILNNVEGMTMALGMGPGMAGLLTMVGVAAFLAKPHIEALWALFTGEGPKRAISEIEALKVQLDKLDDKKIKTAIDYSDIDEAKRRLSELEKAQAEYDAKHHTSDQAEAGRIFAEMLANAPGGEDATKQKIQSRIVNDRSQGDPELQSAMKEEAEEQLEMDNLKGVPGLAATQSRARHEKKLEAAKEAKNKASLRIEKDAEQEVGGMLAGGKAGDAAAQARYRSELEKVGQGDLATMLGIFANPDEVHAQRQEKVDLANQKRMAELGNALKEKDRKDFEAHADIVEKQQSAAQKKALAEITKGGSLDKFASQTAGEAGRQGLEGDEAFAYVRDHVRSEIETKMKGRGVGWVGEHVAAAAEQLATKGLGLEKADARVAAQLPKDRIQAQVKAEDFAAKQGGYNLRAEAELARVGAQGGDTDRFGRFHRMTPQQQQEHVRREVEAELRRRNPKMDAEDAWGKSQRITATAGEDLSRRLMGASMQGMTVQQQGVALQHQFDAELTQMGQKQQDMALQIRQLRQRSGTRQAHAQRTNGAG